MDGRISKDDVGTEKDKSIEKELVLRGLVMMGKYKGKNSAMYLLLQP